MCIKKGLQLSTLTVRQREWLLVISACLTEVIAGQVMSGPVYANYMKRNFDLSQAQLDFCISLMSFGTVLIFVSGWVFDRFGAKASIAFGGGFATATSVGLALAMTNPAFLRDRLWLLYCLMFLYGHSLNYGHVTATGCGMRSFVPERRGCIMTLITVSYAAGPPLTAFLYYIVFGNSQRSLSEQSALGMVVTLAVLTAAVHVFAFFFLTPLPIEKPDSDDDPTTPILSHHKSAGSINHSEETQASQDQRKPAPATADSSCATESRDFFKHCLLSARFLPLLLAFALTYGSHIASTLNMTSVTRSLRLTKFDMHYFWISYLIGIAWRCAIGPLSDRYFYTVQKRSVALLIGLGCLGAPALLMLCLRSTASAAFPITLVAYTLINVSAGTLLNLTSVLISQTEPPGLFGRLFSSCLMLGQSAALPLMLQFDALYDAHATNTRLHGNGTLVTVPWKRSSAECFGQECYVLGGLASFMCHLAGMGSLFYYTLSAQH